MENDVRTVMIDILEEFARDNGLKFVWATERRPEGSTTVNFKRASDNESVFTLRITYNDISNAQGDPRVITDRIIDELKKRL